MENSILLVVSLFVGRVFSCDGEQEVQNEAFFCLVPMKGLRNEMPDDFLGQLSLRQQCKYSDEGGGQYLSSHLTTAR